MGNEFSSCGRMGGDETLWSDLRDSNYEKNVEIMFPFLGTFVRLSPPHTFFSETGGYLYLLSPSEKSRRHSPKQ